MFFPGNGQKASGAGDFLTCGGCRKKYVLADLTKFVQHKVLECKKENTCEDEDVDEREHAARHKSLGSPSVSGSGQVDDDDVVRIKNEGEDRKPNVRDNGANTVKSGMLSARKTAHETVTTVPC